MVTIEFDTFQRFKDTATSLLAPGSGDSTKFYKLAGNTNYVAVVWNHFIHGDRLLKYTAFGAEISTTDPWITAVDNNGHTAFRVSDVTEGK